MQQGVLHHRSYMHIRSKAATRPLRLDSAVRRRSGRRAAAAVDVRADVTAGFLEAVATAALQSRLRSHSLVRTAVECDGWGLLSGRVDSIAIAGRDWVSPLGLSARVLEVSLGRAALDVPAILQKQRIYLQGVPRGTSRIVFTAPQFAGFLQHPLMLAACATAVQGQRFAFERYAQYDLSAGAIVMAGTWAGDGQRYQLAMRPFGAQAVVSATHLPGPHGAQQQPQQHGANAAFVGLALSTFFSRLTLNLQGPELSYASMRIIPGVELPAQPGILPMELERSLPFPRGAEPVLDLRLTVQVFGFPPSDPQF